MNIDWQKISVDGLGINIDSVIYTYKYIYSCGIVINWTRVRLHAVLPQCFPANKAQIYSSVGVVTKTNNQTQAEIKTFYFFVSKLLLASVSRTDSDGYTGSNFRKLQNVTRFERPNSYMHSKWLSVGLPEWVF